jgi:hypothetical protein
MQLETRDRAHPGAAREYFDPLRAAKALGVPISDASV